MNLSVIDGFMQMASENLEMIFVGILIVMFLTVNVVVFDHIRSKYDKP